ncbi:MAG: hypothetical protein WCT26_04340 [Candidatus Buchananbacteria bacterium]|jgi:cell division protein FtsL
MSPLWKKLRQREKLNHHFPELTSSNDLKSWFWNLTRYRSSLAILAIVNIIAGFFYLTQTNLTATSGFEIKSLEKEIAELQEANTNYNLSFIKLQSMDQIVSGAKNLNLVPADNVETLNADANTIALR